MKVDKIPEVTDEKWLEINTDNRKMVEEFLRESMQLSPQTLKQYESALKIYFVWVMENAGNKRYDELKPRDFLSYQNFLTRRGLSSSAVGLKRSVVSSFNNYLETYYIDDLPPSFRNYVTRKIPAPTKAFVNEKEPLTIQEYDYLCAELEKQELWQILAYVKFSYATGARRGEVRQLKKEVIDYEPKISSITVKDENGNTEIRQTRSYITHDIRCKGKGKEGKIRKLQFDEKAMLAIKKWLDVRGDDECEYVFISGSKKDAHQVATETLNAWCDKYLEPIVGRRVHPHLLRESRATNLVVEQGRDIKVAQKLLGHENSATTQIYVIRKDEDASDEAFVE